MADGVGVNGVAVRRTGERPAGGSWSDRQIAWLLVLPAALLILALSIYPLLYSVWVAFVNYDFQIPGHAFVGLGNFREIVNDPIARLSLVNTVILSAACVTVKDRWRFAWPHQTLACLINHLRVSVEHGLFEVCEVVVIKGKRPLEGAIRYPPLALEHGDGLLQDLLERSRRLLHVCERSTVHLPGCLLYQNTS